MREEPDAEGREYYNHMLQDLHKSRCQKQCNERKLVSFLLGLQGDDNEEWSCRDDQAQIVKITDNSF